MPLNVARRVVSVIARLVRPGQRLRWNKLDRLFAVRRQLEELESRAVPSTVTWDGGAGTFNWLDAANWDTNTLPGPNDDVVIGTVSDPYGVNIGIVGDYTPTAFAVSVSSITTDSFLYVANFDPHPVAHTSLTLTGNSGQTASVFNHGVYITSNFNDFIAPGIALTVGVGVVGG